MPRHVNSQVPVLRTAEPAPAVPQQARSIAKRRKLLEASRLLFGEKGYEATSIQDITARAGTSLGAFYLYFASKQQILVVLMNEFLERLSRLDLRPKPDAGRSVRDNLRDFLAAAFRVDVAYFGVVRAWQEASLTDPELGRMQREIERWSQARVLGVLRQLQRHPSALGGRDLPAFARMMDRQFWSLLARSSRMTPRNFHREVALAADVIYHYLFCDSPQKGRTK